jgi:hypothetical protein
MPQSHAEHSRSENVAIGWTHSSDVGWGTSHTKIKGDILVEGGQVAQFNVKKD